MGLRRLMQACLLLVLLALTRGARAQPEPLVARLVLDRTGVRAQFSILSAFTDRFRKRLSDGLTSRAVLAVELLDSRGDAVVLRERQCELRLDVWDDQVYTRIRDEQRLRQRKFALIDDALKACGLVDIPMVSLERLTEPGDYRIRVRIALNPISRELLERSRQFTSNPRGTASGRPQAFFGAVARLFRSESDVGGTVFLFLSGPLPRPSTEAAKP